MFSSLNSAVITGGTFNSYTVTNQSQDPYERLREATAPNAFHDSGERRDPPKCHHNTRVAILERILLWILTCDSDAQAQASTTTRNKRKSVMWVYGPAGAGKSAIAQSIADVCDSEQLLLASFFFSRFDGTRNRVGAVVPTVAYQVMQRFGGETGRLLGECVRRDPLVFTRSLRTQIVSLIVRPLKPLVECGYFDSGEEKKCRRVVIVDGLDECEDREGQLEVLDAIQHALVEHDLPLLFLVASRPEHDLMGAFRSEPLHSLSAMIPLDDGYQSHRDIERFLRDKFTDLKATHPFRSRIPEFWPSEDVIQQLVVKSSGQFIYAATVIKYITSTRHRPPDRLAVILGLQPANKDMPFSELDALYTHIFASLVDVDPVLRILAFHVLSATRYMDHVGHMEEILGMVEGDTEVVLCDLGSVLQVVEQADSDTRDRTLRVFHASLEDYLLDKSRSGPFWVDAPSRHAEFAHLYMQHFQTVYATGDASAAPFAGLFDLAAHIRKASPTMALRDEILSFSRSFLCVEARTVIPELQLQLQPQWQNDVLDFLKAVKESRFEDAGELYGLLRLELGVLIEEKTYEQSVLAPYSFTPFPSNASPHPLI